jgi:hypothetical protein
VSASGNIYYVATNGNDANPGTSALPWRTIGKAAQTASPGDTVYIRDGIYNESVSLNRYGTEENPIKIEAFPGEHPVIDGEYAIPGYWGALLYINGNYIQVSGIEIRNSAYMGIVVRGNYDLVDDVYVHHTNENGILITQGSHSTVQNSRVWRASLSNEYAQGSGWSSALSAARQGVSYATIRNNIVWEGWGEGISCYESDHSVIEGNITHDNYSANLYISDSTNVLCQRNFVYRDPNSYVFGYGSHSGIMMGDEKYTPASANITVINNISSGNRDNFYWWQGVQGGGMNNVLIANNTFVNAINPSWGGNVIIAHGDHQGVRFENNIVQQDDNKPVIVTASQPGVSYSHNLWSKAPQAAASGPDDIVGNPLLNRTGTFYDPDWYHLTAASPAIDHGLSIPEVLVDFFNLIRDSSPDMGAIDHVVEKE